MLRPLLNADFVLNVPVLPEVEVDHEKRRLDALPCGELHVAIRPLAEEGDGLLAGKIALRDFDHLRLCGGVRGESWIFLAANVAPRVEFGSRRLFKRGGVEPERSLLGHDLWRSGHAGRSKKHRR